MHPGQGPGLSLYDLGEASGSQMVTLLQSEMPAHQHTIQASSFPANYPLPKSSVSLSKVVGDNVYHTQQAAPQADFALQSLVIAGGSAPHDNMMTYLTVNFCIALQGVYPPRT